MFNSKGFSVLSALITSGLIGIVVSSAFMFSSSQTRTARGEILRSTAQDLVMSIVTEVYSKTAEDLPDPGKCLIRYYDNSGNYTGMSVTALIAEDLSDPCASPAFKNIVPGELIVITRVNYYESDPDSVNTEFFPSEYLQPQEKSLLSVEIEGAFPNPKVGTGYQSVKIKIVKEN